VPLGLFNVWLISNPSFLDIRDSLICLDLVSNDPIAEAHLFSGATKIMNILSKNDSAQNVCTGYSINKIQKFRTNIKAHSKVILDVFSSAKPHLLCEMRELLNMGMTLKTKKFEHAEVLVSIWRLFQQVPSLKDCSAFGCATRSSKNIDDFLVAMEMNAEDANVEIARKRKVTCNAQLVKFLLGEKERTYLSPGLPVDPVEFPFCAGCGHEFIDFLPSNDGIANVNTKSMHEYLAQKEKLRLWNDDSSVHPQPTCPTSGKLLTKIPAPVVVKLLV
jgi:hypothetical protein